MSTLTIQTLPPLVLSEPVIVEIGAVRHGGGGESPTLDIALDPQRGELAAQLDPPPLRVRARLVFDDGETFAGIVQAVRLGPQPSIVLES